MTAFEILIKIDIATYRSQLPSSSIYHFVMSQNRKPHQSII
jgi:hypothetical protein